MSKKNVDKIKDKISKLLAKANGSNNAAESASFMAKVEEMLAAHQLEIGDLVKADPMERTIVWTAPKTMRQWHWMIPSVVCRYYGCKMIRVMGGPVIHMVAVGRESTRVTAELMMPFIVDQLRAQAAEYRKVTLYTMKKSMDDICDQFTIRLNELIAAREATEKNHGRQDRALMLIDEASAAMAEMFPNMKTVTGKDLFHNELAREHADKVNLNDQVKGTEANGEQIAAPALQLTHG